jgi:subtilisin family serine protease
MAIRYAVDNGAQVINMSFGKEFSLHKKWVLESFQYAEEHNVLLVHCSGNNGFNVDENPYYPAMLPMTAKEVCNNFINVGSISSKLDSSFVSSFSNKAKCGSICTLKKSILLRQGILMLQILALHLLAQWFRDCCFDLVLLS